MSNLLAYYNVSDFPLNDNPPIIKGA